MLSKWNPEQILSYDCRPEFQSLKHIIEDCPFAGIIKEINPIISIQFKNIVSVNVFIKF